MTGWPQVRLREVSVVITKGTTPTTLGHSFTEQGINFVKSESITWDGRIDSSKFVFIDEATNHTLKRSILAEGDVLFSMAGMHIGKTAVVSKEILPANTNQAVGIIRLNHSKAEPRFIEYVLRNKSYNVFVNSLVAQSAQPNLNLSEIGNLPVPLPSVSEQQAIAAVLGALDDKIELNRRMNETLEALAQTLFQALVLIGTQDRMPKGWRVSKLGETLSVVETGGRPKGGVGQITEGVPSVGAESIVGLGKFDFGKTKYVPREFFESMTRGHVADGDVLLYKDGGRPGEFEPHVTMVGDGFPFDEFSINEHVYRLRTEPALPQSYLYFWLSSDGTMDEMRNRGTGVAIPGLNSTQVRELSIVLPPPNVLKEFDENVSPLIRRIFANCNESRTLAALRDTLLPKLLSGAVRVKGNAHA